MKRCQIHPDKFTAAVDLFATGEFRICGVFARDGPVAYQGHLAIGIIRRFAHFAGRQDKFCSTRQAYCGDRRAWYVAKMCLVFGCPYGCYCIVDTVAGATISIAVHLAGRTAIFKFWTFEYSNLVIHAFAAVFLFPLGKFGCVRTCNVPIVIVFGIESISTCRVAATLGHLGRAGVDSKPRQQGFATCIQDSVMTVFVIL